MKLVAKFFVLFLFAFVLFTNPLTVSAQSNASGLCDDSDMYSCNAPYSCYCPPLNPADPNNTIIPNYSTRACVCVPPGPSVTPVPNSGGPYVPVCTFNKIDCPAGSTRGTVVISTSDITTYDLSKCGNTLGTAQSIGACTQVVYDPDQGFDVCVANAVNTYQCDNLCPNGQPPVCTDVPGANYTTTTDCRRPTVCPNGDTYVSHVNGGAAAGTCYIQGNPNDSDYGNPVYNTVTTCTGKTRTCSCGATSAPVVTASPIPSGQCSMTKIYTNNWTELTPQAFTGLTQGIQVYFCVNGVTNTNVFDAGRFTINGVVRPETTVTKPGTNDFCDLYTIPANTYTFKVQGELHHAILGWL